MNPYPTLSRKPSHVFSVQPDKSAVLIGKMSSGYPVMNKLFTFDPITFTFELRSTSEADKLDVMTFYENNKEVPFHWLNTQDGVTYEVAYVSPPRCRIDGRIDLWRINEVLRQTSSETS